MAVEAVTSNPIVSPASGTDTLATPSPDATGTTKKVDPNSDEEVLTAAVEAFLPSMVSNTLMLNNTLFNFAKEAIDEGDQE